jgi:formylglycine-generating enzyme required for sulfatase activity
VLAVAACHDKETAKDKAPADASQSRATAAVERPPELLYLPDGGDIGPPRVPGQGVLPGPWGFPSKRCPPEMVDIRAQFCIDRYEAALVDAKQGREISPYYHPTRQAVQREYGHWQKARLASEIQASREMPVPPPPVWELKEEFEPKAVVEANVVPSGYMSADLAEVACKNAGKRLCTPDEWRLACRGDGNRKFPYGTEYVQGRCNVFREGHPAEILHGNASINHLDPRLNQVRAGGKPLLRRTGATPECASTWGSDAVYDMVGNLDEWVDDPKGLFLGGFFSRSTKEGCDSSISAHPRSYFDYSLGVRCCR